MDTRDLMKGNEALAEAAIRSGCRYYFGYPITPQSEIPEYMAAHLPEAGGVFIQGESEIASVNMVMGAASTGARAMTSSAGLGIALKSEGIAYMAGMDLPAVIVNVQRGGPGLGGIQPSQSDYFQATKATGNGDFYLLVYAPASVQEMADLVSLAFDKAEEYRMPAMILADGAIGQMMEPVSFEHIFCTRHEKPWALTGTQNARPHNIINSMNLNPAELEQENIARFERYRLIKENELMCEEYLSEDAEVIVVAYGIAARVAKTAVRLAREKGIKAGLIRPITLWPFPEKQLQLASQSAKAFVCAELSMGQMIEDVRSAIEFKKPVSLVNRVGGMLLSPEEILAAIEKAMGE